jgi:hypothetical protein
MTTFYGLNASGASTLFSSLSSSNSNSTTSLLSDYASIKSGSYYKLLKAYYSQTSSDETTTSTITDKLNCDNTAWKEVASDISSLKSSASTLSTEEYTEKNRSEIEKEISSFVKNYNAVLDSSEDVNSSSLSKKAEWMTKITSNYSDALEKVGITVKSDNTLSLDSDKLSSASLEDIKSVFSDSYSYAGQINSTSRLMAQVAANNGSSNTASLYTSSGTYNYLSGSSMYDILF